MPECGDHTSLLRDDVMIFTKGTEGATRVVNDILQTFSTVSGLNVSENKSVVFLSGVEVD